MSLKVHFETFLITQGFKCSKSSDSKWLSTKLSFCLFVTGELHPVRLKAFRSEND